MCPLFVCFGPRTKAVRGKYIVEGSKKERRSSLNIVLISCDTLRADHLGCYGYPLPTSPYLDQIASEGVLFEQAFGADVPTEPVHTALFTGRWGAKTGIVAHGAHNAYLSKETPWLPSILWSKGFSTAACDNLYQLKEWFARGYGAYINTVSRKRWIDGKDVNAAAIDWLKTHGGKEPFFLFLHYWDPHTPYLPPESYRRMFYDDDPFSDRHTGMEQVRAQPIYPFFHQYHYRHLGPVTDPRYISALYDAEIRYLDDCLREFDESLKEAGLYEDTLLVIMGDHGECLYEHDIYWDHAGLYDAVVKVPMIMRWPARIPAGTRVSSFVQHVDIFPTLLEAAGVDVPEGGDGQSLWPLIHGDGASIHEFIVHAECNWQASRAIRTREWKLIQNIDPWMYQRPPLELYNLIDDPQETKNLADLEPKIADELFYMLLREVDKRLGNRPDPIRQTLTATGVPAVARLERTMAQFGLTWQEWLENPDPSRIGL